MKKFGAIGLSLFLLVPTFASGATLQDVQPSQNGNVRIVESVDGKGTPSFVKNLQSQKFSKANGQSAKDFLESNKDTFKIKKPQENLKELRVKTDSLGMTHIRLQQTKNGIPVDGHQINVHFNSDNQVTSVNGSYDPEVEEQDIQTVPSISQNEALSVAKNSVDAPEQIAVETAELVVYPYENDYKLAYRINLEILEEKQGNWYVYVDANTGNVLDQYDAMTGFGFFSDVLNFDVNENQENSKQGPNPIAIERASKLKPSSGSGTGTTGDMKNLQLSHGNIPGSGEGSTFYLADTTTSSMGGIFTYNMKNTANQTWLYSDKDAAFKDVTYSGDSSSWEAVGQGPAVDAHSNSRIVYDYFFENHGRNSLDNNGMAIRSRVHYGKAYNNAFWSNGIAMMTYGDGDGKQFIPLASLDVTAHEMVHGITHYNGGLRYRFETGAINEAFSDTFAAIVDDANWDVGEDIMGSDWLASGRTALRSNEDPGKFKVGSQYWAYSIDGEGRYPAHMSEYYYLPANMDNGGVHINCTILQHSAYLVAEKYGMGRKVVADTWYRAYDYLHYDASFSEFREAILQSATDLYGENSKEYQAFLSGFDDIGLYEGWSSLNNPRAPR